VLLFIVEKVHNPTKAVKALLKIVGILAVGFIIWKFFKHTTFDEYDALGTVAAIAVLTFVLHQLFGKSDD
jgi:hypothetical protein